MSMISTSNSTNGVMEVKLVAAKGLKGKDFFDKIDPYVVIQYRDQMQKSRIVRGHRGNPVWNEEFKFRVEYPAAETDNRNYNYKLVLQIIDHHAFISDHDLGQTTIYLKEVFERGVEKGEAEIGVQKYRVVSTDLTYNGEIQVGVHFTTKV
ncbi:UNVERIFIED_CONTAM: phloem protein 1 [Sesamum latifolium]|uniref:Phloem protein 1 n=1 Tax=Sesamum latifolium TaxID=2727402 RepID=A0AAW2XSZ3_9LAMI